MDCVGVIPSDAFHRIGTDQVPILSAVEVDTSNSGNLGCWHVRCRRRACLIQPLRHFGHFVGLRLTGGSHELAAVFTEIEADAFDNHLVVP